ncbi:MAG: 50S ribosomal protein L22 [Planctomycetes bacterium]|nr:50S ribosomal protein L22 [Planctomycetota bacterium]
MAKPAVKPPRLYESTYRGFRQSEKKARLVMDTIRGMNALRALDVLRFTQNRAARPIEKTIQSAIANAIDLANRDGISIDEGSLVVCEARVDQGFHLKRWRPRSRGMANPIHRRFCHFHIKLVAEQDLEALQLYRKIVSQKLRVDRIKDLKGLELVGAEESAAAEQGGEE